MADKRNDSTSCLSTERINFTKGNSTEFSIDLAIVHEDLEGTWYRLIHKKLVMMLMMSGYGMLVQIQNA